MCFFKAANLDVVEELNDTVKIPIAPTSATPLTAFQKDAIVSI